MYVSEHYKVSASTTKELTSTNMHCAILVRREVFKWAGWVARLNVFDPSRITLHVLLHKNWDWLRVIADQFNGRQLHGRRLKVWRWEALVYKFFDENFPGTSWIQAAQDKSEWEDLVQTIQ